MGGQSLIPPSGDARPVAIRPASMDDAPRLAALCGQLWYPTTVERVEQRLRHLQPDEQHCVYVAELPDNVVVGWIYVYLIRSLLDDPQAEIGGLIVDEGCRGQRIGERLLKQAEQWAGERGCCAISVHSNVIRKDAHRFYERLGYRVVKTQFALRRDLARDHE
jgi:GNAT superfamily N-acetyltransferase